MIYTIVPISQIINQNENIQACEEMTINGVRCYVEKINDFEYKIMRIHTSNPQNYLKQNLQPGTIINLKDKF